MRGLEGEEKSSLTDIQVLKETEVNLEQKINCYHFSYINMRFVLLFLLRDRSDRETSAQST